MSDEGFAQYLFPLLFFILYFLINRKKKKKSEPNAASRERVQVEEDRTILPTKVSLPPSLPPASRTLPTLSSQIETRRLEPSLNSAPSMNQQVSASSCRASRALRTLPSLKEAFVIREIFRRVDEEF